MFGRTPTTSLLACSLLAFLLQSSLARTEIEPPALATRGSSMGTGKGSAVSQAAAADSYPASPVRYEIDLSNEQLSIFNAAIQAGILQAGGEAKVELSLRRTASKELRWTLIIRGELERQGWEYWINNQASEVLAAVDLDNVDADTRRVVTVVKSALSKIKAAKEAPVYDPSTIAGVVESVGATGDVTLKTATGDLTVQAISSLGLGARAYIGKPVVVTGSMVAAAHLAPTRFIAARPNTLELAVMSHCPFGRKAILGVINALRQRSQSLPQLQLQVRYIFKENRENGVATYTALHGDAERTENLVQIVLRDEFAANFEDYLFARASANPDAAPSVDKPWQDIARGIGMSDQDIAHVQARINTSADQLIAAELAEARANYGELNASPTFIYESVVLPGPEGVPGLDTLNLGTGSCDGH